MQIACLHTIDSNIAIFEAAAEAIGLPKSVLHHTVRADLLDAAGQAGGLTEAIRTETVAVLRELSGGADAVLLTCSTLGPSVEALADAPVPVMRVDRALARQAVKGYGKIVVLCAASTTLGPTTRLFEHEAAGKDVEIEVRLVPEAWAFLQAGDNRSYLDTIADAADTAYRDGAGVVALAQASMAGAADLVTTGPPPLTSPKAGLVAILEDVRKAA
jgi:hypothetical protein